MLLFGVSRCGLMPMCLSNQACKSPLHL